MNVLEKIDELRLQKGWSVNNLAMEAGLTQSTLNNIYSRKTEPKLSTLRAICDAFGITLSEFFREGSITDNNECRLRDEELQRLIANLSNDEKNALIVILKK